jgi:hypothetical protein
MPNLIVENETRNDVLVHHRRALPTPVLRAFSDKYW